MVGYYRRMDSPMPWAAANVPSSMLSSSAVRPFADPVKPAAQQSVLPRVHLRLKFSFARALYVRRNRRIQEPDNDEHFKVYESGAHPALEPVAAEIDCRHRAIENKYI